MNGTERERFSKVPASSIHLNLIPLYFTLVITGWLWRGVLADNARGLSGRFLALSLLSVGLAARPAGFRKLIINIAITTNARRPGIVLASVAYDAGIINAASTPSVLAAVLTSQATGVWLRLS